MMTDLICYPCQTDKFKFEKRKPTKKECFCFYFFFCKKTHFCMCMATTRVTLPYVTLLLLSFVITVASLYNNVLQLLHRKPFYSFSVQWFYTLLYFKIPNKSLYIAKLIQIKPFTQAFNKWSFSLLGNL